MEDSVFNHSSADFATSVIDAAEIIAKKIVDDAGYDRTIQATIITCTSNTKGEYKCKYQDSKFLAYAPNPDVTYSEDTLVYVLIPGNDWNATKTILGTVDKLGVDYIANITNKEYFDPIGDNVVDGNAIITLNTWDGSHFEPIYDKEQNINLIGLNTTKVEDYFKDENATYFYVQADFKSNVEATQRLGRYGLKITTSRASKEGTQEYYFFSDDMEGEPRHFTNWSTQNNFKKPFLIETTIDNNAEINDFGEILKIEAFVDNYTQEEGHDPDIQICNFVLIALHRLSEMDMTDGYLSIVTPLGSIFYRKDGAIIPNLVKMQARVRMNGVISEDPDIKYYWFRQDARVYGGSDYEDLYCPISGANTHGWACLNTFSYDGGERIWNPAPREWALSPRDVVAKKLTFKCVAIYDTMIMEREIVIQNKAADYDITILSENGYKFYQDQGDTILTCAVDWGLVPPPADLHYYWASISSEGIFNSEFYDNPVTDTIYAASIKGFVKYLCTIYSDNTFIGTGLAILTNSDITTAGTYYLNITNGDQSFQYDEEGMSPVRKGQPLRPLEVEFYDSQGNQLTSEEVLRSTNIKWYFPADSTNLVLPDIPEQPYEYEDPTTGLRYWVYENLYNMPFKIADYFNDFAQRKQIKLTVEYNGNTYIDKTTFSFGRNGDPGTNGTKYSFQIVPNTNSDFTESRVWITEKSDGTWSFNFTPRPNEFPFKVLIYRSGELLYSNYVSGSARDIQFNIKWEICDGNANSIFNINGYDFIYNGFPATIRDPFNNLLKVTVNIRNTEDAKDLYSFLPIGVTKILNTAFEEESTNYYIGLVKRDGIYAGFTQAIYNSDGENPLYNEMYPFDKCVMNGDIDVTGSYTIKQTFLGSNLIYADPDPIDPDDPNSGPTDDHIIPSDYYEGIDVCNAVLYKSNNNFVIYAPVVFAINRYGLASLNAWDGTHIEINEEGGYIYAPQLGAGEKDEYNRFTGVLLGKVSIPNSTDKIGFMAYGHGRRTVWIDALTGKAEFGAGKGRIIFDPDEQGTESCIYGGDYDPNAGTGMCINLNEPSIRWGNGKFIVDADGMIQAINILLKRPNNEVYYQLDQFGLVLDVGDGTYPYNLDLPSATKRKLVVFDSRYSPNASYMKVPTNAVAEFGDDGIALQALNAGSYLRMKNSADDPYADKGPNVALKSGNALYLTSGILDPGELPVGEEGEDPYTSNASVNIKAAYNGNIWAGHGLNIRVTKPHEKDEGAHPKYPDMQWDDTYGYLKLETQYGWIYMSSKAGGKKNTPGIGINAYTWNKRQDLGEYEGDPYTRYPNQDYKVYINGNEVLTNGNIADSTNGDIGGVAYVSEFGNIRPYLDRLVSLGSYYEEGDGIAAWRHVVTYDTVQVSDKREKKDIEDLDSRYVNFIMTLRPKKYHYIKTGEKEYRTGFIAQEVETDLNDAGLTNEEFGGLKKKPINMYGKTVDYGYGLNYDDFVAALVLTVQDLQKQINELKKEIKKDGT